MRVRAALFIPVLAMYRLVFLNSGSSGASLEGKAWKFAFSAACFIGWDGLAGNLVANEFGIIRL